MTAAETPVTIEGLDIVRAPGFETGGFEIDGFSPGINLVHGPNAAGKTTTANSIVKVLWPETATAGERLVGRVSMNGEQWRVDVTAGEASYQRDGRETAPPNLPSTDHRDRYRLSLHDLLQQGTRNERFAETIARESAGGYDLSAAHETLNYGDTPISRRAGVYQDAKAAIDAWRSERDAAKSLEEERSRLSKLRDELTAAKQAEERIEAIDQAITYREATSAYENAKATLAAIPDAVGELTGTELQLVDELDEEIAEWEAERDAAEEKKATAKATLEATALPEDGVPDGVIGRLQRRRDRLEDAESRRDELTESLEGAIAERESAREDIPLDVDHETVTALEPETWAVVSEFARTAEQVQAARQRRAAIEEWASDDEKPETALSTLERGSKALENWLLAGPEADSGSDAAFRIGVIASILVSGAGVALGTLVHPLLLSVILLGIGLFVYGYRHREGSKQGNSKRGTHRESFEATGLASPASWTEDDVRNRLVELYDAIATHKVVEERQQQRDAVLAEGNLERKEAALAEKRAALREEIGVPPETGDIELAVIVRRVLDWQDAHDDVIRKRAELEQTREHLDEARHALRNDLEEYGYDGIEEAADATERIRDLQRQKTDFETATRAINEAEETIEKAERKREAARTERDRLFTAAGLEPGDRDGLRSLCDRVEEYERATSEVDRTEAVVAQEREKLEAHPSFDPALQEATVAELQERRREATATAERRDDIQEQIADIEAKIREAKADTALEAALTEKERALDALSAELEADYSAVVGDALIEHVREETIEASRPAVFQRANDVLATITHGQFELILEEDTGAFRAFDTGKGMGFALDELSSATRVQVLLAVRLAFVEHQEQGLKLPILLDETLANTDDVRAGVIIDSLIELARDGRQLFYFTAQGDEVAKWRAALADRPDVAWETIDLGDLRDLDRHVRTPDIDSVEAITPDPPDSNGYDHHAYGEALQVEDFNPYRGSGSAHLWYVLDDVEALYDLLAMGIERWGQLRNLLERGRSDFVPVDAETLSRVQANGAALETFAQSWQIGRGEPVDRTVLDESGAVSETFIDRVASLAKELDGDGEALVDALYRGEVDQFRRNKAEELEAYLRANGYIVSRDPLEDGAVRLRMVERLVEEGVSKERAATRATDLLKRLTGS